MEPIGNPKFAYSRPPQDGLPNACPRCGTSLEHFDVAPNYKLDVGDLYQSDIPKLIETPDLVQSGGATPDLAAAMTLPKEQQCELHQLTPVPGLPTKLPFDDGLTIVVFLTGNNTTAHTRCLDSLRTTITSVKIDLRIALGKVSAETATYAKQLPWVVKVYPGYVDGYKYAALRDVLQDTAAPIKTEWLCWFDGDCFVKNTSWITALQRSLASALAAGNRIGMVGRRLFLQLPGYVPADPRHWYFTAPWFRRRDFRDRNGRAIPNGDCLHFCDGGFWCANVAALKTAGVPDRRLRNLGDFVIGEQLYQAGYELSTFNEKGAFVHVPDKSGDIDIGSIIWPGVDPLLFSGRR